jgi:ketosteroid isomerase-like protein
MSQENVELAYRAMDAFNRRDIDAYLALMDDDVEIVPRIGAVEGENSYRGHEGARRWWSNVSDVFPDWKVVIIEARDLGDLTFVATRP